METLKEICILNLNNPKKYPSKEPGVIRYTVRTISSGKGPHLPEEVVFVIYYLCGKILIKVFITEPLPVINNIGAIFFSFSIVL